MRWKLIIGMSLWMTKVCAGFVVDIYGDDSFKGQAILNKYQPALVQLERLKLQLLEKKPSKQNQLLNKKLKQRHEQLIKRIKKEGRYLYVNDSVVVYPRDPIRYITLEVITVQDKDRMRWVHSSTRVNDSPKQDVIQAMIDYEEAGTRLMINNQLDLKHLDCQSYHCSFGFKHPELGPFRKRFDEGLAHERQRIIEGLDDPNPVRRAAAAFVVGEFDDPQIIFQLLLPHVNDVDSQVRNNVIRVLGDTMIHSRDYQIDVKPFIELLRSPYVSDRNKSLVVLMEAAELEEQKALIKKEGLASLQALVKLKQPNNHDFAQIILTKLAKKNG